jgi:hypothetical protein
VQRAMWLKGPALGFEKASAMPDYCRRCLNDDLLALPPPTNADDDQTLELRLATNGYVWPAKLNNSGRVEMNRKVHDIVKERYPTQPHHPLALEAAIWGVYYRDRLPNEHEVALEFWRPRDCCSRWFTTTWV